MRGRLGILLPISVVHSTGRTPGSGLHTATVSVLSATHATCIVPRFRLLCGGGRLSCQATIDLTLPAMLGWLESEYRKVDISQSGLKDWAAYWVANHVIAFDQLPGNVAAPEAARDVAEPALVPA